MSRISASYIHSQVTNLYSVNVLVPTMHIHLLALRSPSPLTIRLGMHKLDFCMTIMAELGSTYWSAEVIYKLFKEAIEKLARDVTRETSTIPAASEGQVSDLPNREDNIPLELTMSEIWDSYVSPSYDLSK